MEIENCLLCGSKSRYSSIHTYCIHKEQALAYSDIIPPLTYVDNGGYIMTEKRTGVYVYVTWLARLMAGEIQCHWAPWFRCHYTGYTKAPSDFQIATWTVEHNKCLDEVCKECSIQSLTYFKENQNKFFVNRRGMTIGGTPDLIVLEKDSNYTVYDIKTGQSRASDVIQVMLYMSFLPYSTSGRYRNKTINGCVMYKNGVKTPIPSQSVEDNFKSQVTHFLNILESPTEPQKVPSFVECQYCDITSEDCSERVEADTEGKESLDLPI